ncbi:DEAD/DEAH box helicase family protein [Paenibacillus sp. p3-SID867]|uniref:DEAD/DEAH box helicase family protein n=1 Tax=Paenibacillus sp. p3-SID867 TaxID=2916363 RepID=UPI0021A5CFBC|nr:DEAD/DEAH box helicase family protein [Paenibacillus sp. p3-SID867]MCT1403875.1 DEAD/DEAH box helicase family protein [Paenibacillus sp. p3-SID867]
MSTHVESHNMAIEEIDPSLGEKSVTSLADIENIGDYLELFGPALIRRLNDEYVPVHHPGHDKPLEVLENFKRPLFQAQAHVVTALIKGFKRHRNLFVIGEPGTGKTSVSISVFYSLITELLQKKAGRVLYMVPNHLIKKTKRECGILLDKNLFEVHFLSDYVDVIRLRDSRKLDTKPQKIEVFIIARDTAKLGYIYEPAAQWSDRTYQQRIPTNDGDFYMVEKVAFRGWKCPDCGGQLMKEKEGGLVPMEHDDFFDKHGKPKRRKSNLFCSNPVRLYENSDPDKDETRICGARLWQAKNRNKTFISGMPKPVTGTAPRKVSPAELFKRWFKGKFDLAIGDECHELAGGSAQAHAFHVFLNCARRGIAMTGTLSNGYASSLFELIFRMFPARMKQLGFNWDDVGKWIDLYGVRERVTKIRDEGDLNSSSNGKSKRTSVKEQPAAAPQLFTDILSDVAVFIQMADMFEVLPELSEGPMSVPLEGERKFVNCSARIERRPGVKRGLRKGMRLLAPAGYLKENITKVENLLRAAIEKELAAGGQSLLLGSLLNTLLSYPDVPFNFKGVYHPDTGKCIVPDKYRLSDRLLYPKELQMIKFVRSQLKLGRRVGIYATYTGKMKTLQRLSRLLEERGIKTAILESDVKGKDREEWIADRVHEGVQVILTNPVLVSTGLDLLMFPSLYFYQTGYRLNIVRQASRRHWRIGQANKCLTVYNSYKGTMQELAINLMAAKMSAAQALEGQFSQEGLSALTEGAGGSLATELAKRFVGNNIEGVESAESIWGKMTIDASQFIPDNLVQIAPAAEDPIAEVDFSLSEVQKPESTLSLGVEIFEAQSLQEALLGWANAVIPADLYPRFEQQIEYVVDRVKLGVDGLDVSSRPDSTILTWDCSKAPKETAGFRRWVFHLTNKLVQEQQGKIELMVEGQRPVVKTKKRYNVGAGQIAFNF